MFSKKPRLIIEKEPECNIYVAEKLGHTASRFLAHLEELLNDINRPSFLHDKKRWVHLNQHQWADKLSCSLMTINVITKKLKNLNIIEVKQLKILGTKGNFYTLNEDALEEFCNPYKDMLMNSPDRVRSSYYNNAPHSIVVGSEGWEKLWAQKKIQISDPSINIFDEITEIKKRLTQLEQRLGIINNE